MCRFVRHPLNMIDVVAVLPSYLEWADMEAGGGFAVLRILRLARVFRIFKIAKFNADLQVYVCAWVCGYVCGGGVYIYIYWGEDEEG